MGEVATSLLDSLEKWSYAAFIIGGLALSISVLLVALEILSPVTLPGALSTLLGLGGIWIISIGLLGYYPRIAESAPRLALGGVVMGALGGLVLTMALAWGILLDLITQSTLAEGPPLGTQMLLLTIVLILLSFLLYGVASLRVGSRPRTTGYLLLVPFVALLLLVLIFLGGLLYEFDPGNIVTVALLELAAVGTIAVGYDLRTLRTDRTEPASEKSAE